MELTRERSDEGVETSPRHAARFQTPRGATPVALLLMPNLMDGVRTVVSREDSVCEQGVPGEAETGKLSEPGSHRAGVLPCLP